MGNLEIGQVLKNLRLREGLTQKELSENIDVHLTTIKNWESGGCYPDAKNICILADYFHVSSDTLLGRQHTENITLPDLTIKERKQLFSIIQAYIDSRAVTDLDK